MSLESRPLRAFVAVAEELSFVNAARRLHIAQPALTRTIKEIEAEIGVRLLERTTRVVRLTEAGEAFLGHARRTLSQLEQTVQITRDIGHGLTSHIEIGYMDFAIYGPMPEILARFRQSYPKVKLSLHRRRSDEQSAEVASHRLDLGFTVHHRFANTVEVQTMTREPLVVLLPSDHRLAGRDAISVADLADEDFVMGSRRGWQIFLPIVEEFCGRAGFAPRFAMEVEDGIAMFSAIARGLGVSVYPACALAVGMRGVVVRPFAEQSPEIATYCVMRPDSDVPAIEHMKAVVRSFALDGGGGAI
ncbi:MAG: LysR substrate-binding domain-containing protein [Azospirillaceae bacterium]